MSNLNALSIPILVKPSTLPNISELFLYSNPTKELSTIDSTGEVKRVFLRQYSETVSLTEQFVVNELLSATELVVVADQTGSLLEGMIFIINGSEGGVNDKLFVIRSVVLNPEDNTIVTVTQAILDVSIAILGLVHIPKEVVVKHGLNTLSIHPTIMDTVTKEFGQKIKIFADTLDDLNELVLRPEVPIPNPFLITIIG